jgi:hypothetical protein
MLITWKVNMNKTVRKVNLCLTKHQAMKTYEGVELQLHAFLTLARYGGNWSDSRPGHLTPG